MIIKAIEKVKYHLDRLKSCSDLKAMNKLDVEAIEKVLNYCDGNLNQFIDTEVVFKKVV